MKKLYYSMLQLLEQNQSFVQATILSQSGSAPRTAGAKMLILADGTIQGTIGGGLVEAQVQALAKEVFKTKGQVTQEFNLAGSATGQMDMICGGRLEVLVQYIDVLNRDLLKIYQHIVQALEKRHKVALVTPVNASAAVSDPFLIKDDGAVMGRFAGPANWLSKFTNEVRGSYPQVLTIEGERFLVEPINACGTVYIFGAGHVSQQLARLTGMVDFRTVVIDDRPEFANFERFPGADEVLVVENFARAFENLPIDPDSYLVIVTRGHAHDKTVLGQALKTNACYIGMIGSKRKRHAIYQALQQEGFTENDLNQVYSPIGLAINAETPEEIAVSIAAELIKVRAGQS